jgi:hypothetical protein
MPRLLPFSAIHVQHSGGAVRRAISGETGFGRRDATFQSDRVHRALTRLGSPRRSPLGHEYGLEDYQR